MRKKEVIKMKVKVNITKEIEVEVGEAVAKLDEWYRTHSVAEWKDVPDALIEEATKEVEKATGLSCWDDRSNPEKEVFTSVIAMDGEAIMEW